MPLEALLAAYAGSLNVVGNFVAKTMDFELSALDFTIWAEFDPSGIWGLKKISKPILRVHVDAKIATKEGDSRVAQLQKRTMERDPMHNLLKAAGVRFQQNWVRVASGKARK
jgi:hypothetical protein